MNKFIPLIVLLFSSVLVAATPTTQPDQSTVDAAYKRLSEKQGTATAQPTQTRQQLLDRIKELEQQVADLTAQLNAANPSLAHAKHFVAPPDGQWPTADVLVGVPIADIKKWSNALKLTSTGENESQTYELDLWKMVNRDTQRVSQTYIFTVEKGIVTHADVN